MKNITLVFLLLVLVSSCSEKKSKVDNNSEPTLTQIISGDHRTAENKVRDVYRNPQQTLEFFEIKPDMKVVEVAPGHGWNTEILGPYLKEKGELYLATFSKSTDVANIQNANKVLDDLLASHKDLYGKVIFTTFEPPTTMGPVAPENSMDLVISYRNVHNWMKLKKEKEAFQEFFKALKPGGFFGLVEYEEKPTKIQDPEAQSGYVREDSIITLAESVGFKFMSKLEASEFHLDSSNYREGVQGLNPELRRKDKDNVYNPRLSSGDGRMTLKFVKP